MKIYLLQHGERGPIKIGRAANPTKRLATMLIGCPYDLNMLAQIDAPISVERGLHAKFAKHRIRGEWFKPAKEILDFIALLPNVELPHVGPWEPPKAKGGPLGRKTEFDLEAAKKHLRKHLSVNAAAEHVGVTRQRLWYHVLKDPALMKLKLKR